MSDDKGALLLLSTDPTEQHALGRLAQKAGHEVVLATTLTEARGLLRAGAGPFDAAFLELHLDDGMGIALVPQLRLPPNPCASVIMSARQLHTVAEVAVAEGVHKLLRKPFGPEDFDRALESARRRTREFRSWLDPNTVGNVRDSWFEIMAAAEDADVDSSAFLERMTSIVVRRGQLSPAVARIVPDILLGRDYAAIAANHGVSVETIRTHVKTLLARLSLSSAKAIWQVCVAELDG